MALSRLIEKSDRERFSHAVIVLMKRSDLEETIESSGAGVVNLDISRGRLPGFSALVQTIRAVRKIRPDLIQGWMYHGNLAAYFASLTSDCRVPVCFNIRRGLNDRDRLKPLTKLLIYMGAFLSRRVGGIVNNSEASRIQHERAGYASGKTIILPNGFDSEVFKPDADAKRSVREELGVEDGAFLIGLIGRYHPAKDHANFFAAARILSKDHPHLRFLLAGEDVTLENPVLRMDIEAAGLLDKCILLGKRSDVPRLTAALDVAVSSSYSEGFPNVVGEAMAAGAPCVVTDTGESAAIVGDTGIVVPPKNPEALAEGLRKLVSMPHEQRAALGQAARARIEEHYSIESVVERYERFYEEIIRNRRMKAEGFPCAADQWRHDKHMCGIAGFFTEGGSFSKKEGERIAGRMADAISHRGRTTGACGSIRKRASASGIVACPSSICLPKALSPWYPQADGT